jgi:putative SOS response-associated peptidase YedK
MARRSYWERWTDKASDVFVLSCTFIIIIIITIPNEVYAPIHDRMPVIVAPEDYGKWIGEEPVDPVRLLGMLKPFLRRRRWRTLWMQERETCRTMMPR